MNSRRLEILFFAIAFTIVCFMPTGKTSAIQSTVTVDEKADGSELRVLSYNIHHGEGVDGKLDLQRIANVILSVNPDLVALQEVDRKATRSGKVDQAATLAKLCKMHHVFGGNIDLQGGKYGNAILSKFPVESSKTTKLPNLNSGEQRGYLQATVKIPNQNTPIVFVSTHFDHRRSDTERFQSAKALNHFQNSLGETVVIAAGDFNDSATSRTLKELEINWVRSNDTNLPTVPVVKPKRQIDFIMTSKKSGLVCTQAKVLSEKIASDHRPILSVFQLKTNRK